MHAAAACAQIRPTGSFCCALHASLACLRVCVCGRRLPFEHGGHMLQTLQLADEGGGSLQSSRSTLLPGDDMGSTGTISAQSSGLSLGLGQGQEPLSGTARMPVLMLGAVIKAQTTVIVMPGRKPLLGENCSLNSPRLPSTIGASAPGSRRANVLPPPAPAGAELAGWAGE